MDIEKLSEEWIKAEEAYNKASEHNHWSIDYVIDLVSDEEMKVLWTFILHTYQKDISERVIGALGAGPLEDLLAHAGESYIEEIEALAKKDDKFKHMLGGVWQNAMSEKLWLRVCKAAKV